MKTTKLRNIIGDFPDKMQKFHLNIICITLHWPAVANNLVISSSVVPLVFLFHSTKCLNFWEMLRNLLYLESEEIFNGSGF